MKRKLWLRLLGTLLLACLLCLPLAALAEESAPATLVASRAYGSENYINALSSKVSFAVSPSGKYFIASDENTASNGYLYIYEFEEGKLKLRARFQSAYVDNHGPPLFRPTKVAFAADDTVYCLNQRILQKIVFDENWEEISDPQQSQIAGYVLDFQYVRGTLYTMVLEDSGKASIRQGEALDAVEGRDDLVNMDNPAETFATDGYNFYYYLQGGQAPGLYCNGEKLPGGETPQKLQLAGSSLLLLTSAGLTVQGGDAQTDCLNFDVCGDRIYLLTQKNVVKRCKFAANAFLFDDFTLAKSIDLARPVAMVSLSGTDYLLDREKNRILAGDDFLALPEAVAGAHLLTAARSSLYLATDTQVAEMGVDGKWKRNFAKAGGGSFAAVRALCATVAGDLYLSADGAVWYKPEAADTFVKAYDFDAEALAVSNRNNRLYGLSDGVVTEFAGETQSAWIAHAAPDAVDFVIDFKNRIFALTAAGNLLRLSADPESGVERVETFVLRREQALDCFGTSFTALSLNDAGGSISLLDPALSLVFSLDQSQTEVALSSEIPDLSIMVDPTDRLLNAACQSARIVGYPSTILYPQKGSGEAIRMLDAGTEVLVLDTAQDDIGGYQYVFVRGESPVFGYIVDTNVELLSDSELPGFTEGYAGYLTPIYKYPQAYEPFFVQNLAENTEFSLLSAPVEGWLEVRFESEGNSFTGYVRRASVLKSVVITVDERQNGSVVGIGGATSLYERASLSADVVAQLADTSDVKIIKRAGAFLYVETADGLCGYLESRFVVEEGFANSQKIGLILLSSCVVLGILTVLIRKKIIR